MWQEQMEYNDVLDNVRKAVRSKLNCVPKGIVHVFENSLFTGGAITRIVQDNILPQSDFDFILTARNLNIVKDYCENNSIRCNSNYIPEIAFYENISIQLLCVREDLLNDVPEGDFLDTIAYYDVSKDKLFLTQEQYECMIHKKMVSTQFWETKKNKFRINRRLRSGWTTTDQKILEEIYEMR